jgi:pseudouridine synthase
MQKENDVVDTTSTADTTTTITATTTSIVPKQFTTLLLHKPVGVVCTNRDKSKPLKRVDDKSESGKPMSSHVSSIVVVNKTRKKKIQMRGDDKRKTTYDLLREQGYLTKGQKLGMVGRLDVATSGVLLFTDDAELNFRISRPYNSKKNAETTAPRKLEFHTKEYVVTVSGKGRLALLNEAEEKAGEKKSGEIVTSRKERELLEKEMIEPLTFSQNGYELTTQPALQVRVEKVWQEDHQKRGPRDNGYITADILIRLAEGKNHQVRRICYRSNFKVKKLHRRSIAGMLNEKMVPCPGDIHRLTEKELMDLKNGLGIYRQ